MPLTRSTHWNPPKPIFNSNIIFFIQNGSKTNQKPIFNFHSTKLLKPKILPPNCLRHYLSAVSLFPSRKIDSMGICQKIPKSKNTVLIIPYFPFKGGPILMHVGHEDVPARASLRHHDCNNPEVRASAPPLNSSP